MKFGEFDNFESSGCGRRILKNSTRKELLLLKDFKLAGYRTEE